MTESISSEMKEYFAKLNLGVNEAYLLAAEARSKGLDPETEVPIPLAKNMAERVVGLISVVAPKILGKGIPERILELEKEYGQLDWRVGFKIAEEVAKKKFCSFEDDREAIEVGIRTGFAYLTLGIVSAPLEGLIGIKFKQTKAGQTYFALQYAGPIRAAGGTASSTSVILADYVRAKLGYAKYDPDEKEINRYVSEVHDYHDWVTNLQYHPSDEELRFLVFHLPVEVDGDPTEKREVSNYKDLPRIETNLIRGGVALVLAEGLSQKAPKLWKRLAKWGKSFDLEWDWLGEFIELKKKIHAAEGKGNKEEKDKPKQAAANNTFILDLVAGRPILTYPLREGGFRLRYGRSRNSGFSCCCLHPATLIVLYKYIAIGTQMKTERPGKATVVGICDTLEGPIVRLYNGSVLQLKTEDEAKKWFKEIEEIIFLGDILFNYGDFSENGQALVPAGYCPEWWALELEQKIPEIGLPGLLKKLGLEPSRLQQLLECPLQNYPTLEEAIKISQTLQLPLHPDYTFYWKLVSKDDLIILIKWLVEGKIKWEGKEVKKIILPLSLDNLNHSSGKKTLDFMGISHQIINRESVILSSVEAKLILIAFNINSVEELVGLNKRLTEEIFFNTNGLEFINSISPLKFRDKAGTFIGARMGRPEKAKMRHLTGSPQVMFPVGEEGGRLRSFQAAMESGKIRSNFPIFFCEDCQLETIYGACEVCGKKSIKKYYCRMCGNLDHASCRHGKGVPYKIKEIDIKYYFNKAKEKIGERVIPELIKGIRGTSNRDHLVEHLAKGILRAKHEVYVNKDGTTRYDCTEMPLTHFKPKEIGTSIEKLKQLGYFKDIKGQELVDTNQILELKPQDVILPGFNSLNESASRVLTRVANFLDDLLKRFYELKPFYNIKKDEDLVGHLVIGLAPHISAGLVGRIIGFSETQGLITHPMYHAGMRRDCDGDEACVMLLLDALLNFSRQYLPERRGAKTMDAPLVLTSTLNPAEVDDQVHGIDVAWKYPLELYESALEMKFPWEVKSAEGKKIEQLGDRLGKSDQYENFGYTHSVDNINKGVLCSAYKTELSMNDKLIGQMEIAKKVRAVDMDDVAKLVIQKHFIRDIKGNLRKFSMQRFRCVNCNEKYRRPPLCARCTSCSNGKLIFTITEGSVIKYLYPSLLLASKYDFSPYLKQTLDLLKINIEAVFGKEKDKQVGLGGFMG